MRSYRIPTHRVGRVERQIRGALIASNGRPLQTVDLMRWAFPRATRYEPWRYWSVHRAARKFAIKVRRCGKGNLWIPMPDLARRINPIQTNR